jgi:peptide/nickel transport system permease protein
MMASHAVGGSISDIVLVLSLLLWMPVARIVRGVFLSIREKEYVEAARALGAGRWRLAWRHMLPNAGGPIIVNVTLGVAQAILTESLLSFLGFGIQPPTATWGNMVNAGAEAMLTQPWLVWFPGLMILVTVLAVNFLGDGLRDALDPSGRGPS